MRYILITLFAALLVSLASAQEFTLHQVASAYANHSSSVLVECPIATETPTICIRHTLGMEWAKMDAEGFVRNYADLDWVLPWTEHGELLWRMFSMSNGDHYMITLTGRLHPRQAFTLLQYFVLD